MLKNIKFNFSWSRFYEQHRADIRLWLYFIIFQQLCRLYFIFTFSFCLNSQTKITTILYAMLTGLRFDSLWATCWLFFAFAFLTIPNLFIEIPANNKLTYHPKLISCSLQKYRRYLGGVFTLVTTLIYIAMVEYFREFKNTFDHFMFGWFYDDKIAILKTIYADHFVIPNLLLLALVMFLYIQYSPYFIYKTRSPSLSQPSFTRKIFLSLTIICFYITSFRGSIGHYPIRLQDADITSDTFVNKMVVSPYSALKYAIRDHQALNRPLNNEPSLSTSEILTIAKKFFNTNKSYVTLAKYLEKKAQGSDFPRPKHIFLIVGESLDTWPLQDEYQKFDLTPNLHKIIASSIYFKYFLPCARITINALNSIITGVPDLSMYTNYKKNSIHPYSTALATQFKNLGFKPQLFYGGYLSWERLGDFARAQDFSAIYGSAHFSKYGDKVNAWGSDDGLLFDFIINTIRTAKTPTFNLIMTTSNHPPHTVDLKAEGFNHQKVAALLAQYPETPINTKELGHIWYADKTIGEFIKKMSIIDDSALFIITGDHYSRRHILSNPPLFDTAAVPLIIYSPKINKYCKHHNCKISNYTAGSHLDIGTTLIELIAPKGFTYYAMGDNLLDKRKFNLGLGQDKIITPNFVESIPTKEIMYFNHKKFSSPAKLELLQERFQQMRSLAQYIIKKEDAPYGILNRQTP